MITFSFYENQTNSQNWNESDEKAQARKFAEWLSKSFGSNRKFNWGTISSGYDSKGGSLCITINYSN